MLPRLTLVGLLLAAASALPAQEQDFSKVEIKSVPLGANLYLLEGSGGNIAALTGSDGVLLVDDEFGALADKIRAALRGLGANQPVRFVINTHYHFDHTDGNLAFAQAGAVIIANDNLRARLASGGIIGNGGSISKEVPAAPAGALPAVTYDRELTLHLDGESVRVHHYPNAHTDGDSVVFFTQAKVVHMGDIFVRYGFPFIDTNGGGNVRGMIAACEDVLRTAAPDTQGDPRARRSCDPRGLARVRQDAHRHQRPGRQGARGRQVARADEAGQTAGCLERALRPVQGLRRHRCLHRIAVQLARRAHRAPRPRLKPAADLRFPRSLRV